MVMSTVGLSCERIAYCRRKPATVDAALRSRSEEPHNLAHILRAFRASLGNALPDERFELFIAHLLRQLALEDGDLRRLLAREIVATTCAELFDRVLMLLDLCSDDLQLFLFGRFTALSDLRFFH